MNEAYIEQVYDTIRAMEREREEAHRSPSHILYRNLFGRVGGSEAELKTALNALFSAKRIVVGPTINDKYIHAK